MVKYYNAIVCFTIFVLLRLGDFIILKTVIKKIFSAAITLFLSTIVIFVLIRLSPGNPVEIMLGTPSDLPFTNTPQYEQRVEELEKELGLDQHIFVQYSRWITRLLHFDLGTSIYSGRAVATELSSRIMPTLLLALSALAIQAIFGFTFGILSAIRAHKPLDTVIRFFCIILVSMPAFVLGLLLLLIFSVYFHIYEISNAASLSRIWLPALTIGIVTSPLLIRMIRAGILNEMGQTYITAVYARGLPNYLVVKNALKNALLPIITMFAISFSSLIGGAVVIESVFSWPGVGSYAMNSVLGHDYPVIQGYAVIMVIFIIIVNVGIEILYLFFDPKLRKKGAQKLNENQISES